MFPVSNSLKRGLSFALMLNYGHYLQLHTISQINGGGSQNKVHSTFFFRKMADLLISIRSLPTTESLSTNKSLSTKKCSEFTKCSVANKIDWWKSVKYERNIFK